jgi:hypothetical protein
MAVKAAAPGLRLVRGRRAEIAETAAGTGVESRPRAPPAPSKLEQARAPSKKPVTRGRARERNIAAIISDPNDLAVSSVFRADELPELPVRA